MTFQADSCGTTGGEACIRQEPALTTPTGTGAWVVTHTGMRNGRKYAQFMVVQDESQRHDRMGINGDRPSLVVSSLNQCRGTTKACQSLAPSSPCNAVSGCTWHGYFHSTASAQRLKVAVTVYAQQDQPLGWV